MRAGIVPLVAHVVNTPCCVFWSTSAFNIAHTQLDAPAPNIHCEHAHLHDLPNLYYGQRIADKAVGHLRDMHEAILLDANIHKRAEVDDIAHRALQHHPLFQVFQLQHVLAQNRFRQAIARVESRLFQVF